MNVALTVNIAPTVISCTKPRSTHRLTNKHDTSEITSNELHSVLEAKLNFQSLIDNSRTIEDMMRSPNAKNYLKCSQKNNSEYRNKSPKDFKIDQIPEDTDVYQEINIIKGKAKNSNNLVVNKIFRKKKNAVKYILNRRKESKN